MKNTKKKGFTIVELVVVIAVIAILAAVLVPTFSGIINKANQNADEQTVTNMNKYAAIAAAEGEFTYPSEAVDALYERGFNIGKFKTFSKGFHYAYSLKDNRFFLLNKKDEVVFPEKAEVDKADLWGFFDNEKSDYIEGVNNYIALSAIYNATLFNKDDCVFRNELTQYTIDLAGKSLTVADEDGTKNITLLNGTVLDTVAGGYTLGNGAEAKTTASAADIKASIPASGVLTVEDKLFTSTSSAIIFDLTAAKTVVFENCTFDLSATADKYVTFYGANVESYELIGCTFNLNAGNVFVPGNANAPDLTVKNCTISSGRGLVIGTQNDSQTPKFSDVVIEGNTFVDNGTAQGKPSIQLSASSVNLAGAFAAESITIKNNDFDCKDIAVRIHATVKALDCENIVISGNEFAEGVVKIDGDDRNTPESIAIAKALAPKFN